MNAIPPPVAPNPVQVNYEVNQGGQGGVGRGNPEQGGGVMGGVIRRGGPIQGNHKGVQRRRGGVRGGPVRRGNQSGRGGLIRGGGRGNGGRGGGLQEQGGLGVGRGG